MPIRAADEFSPALRAVCGAGVDAGLVLTPVAVLAAVLGAWRLGVDPGWTSGFFIAGGSLSLTCPSTMHVLYGRGVGASNTSVEIMSSE